eukprot:TRINITY_DN29738_c0_g1_i1.p1 TRINITY_DN29738_c0_g1~~TRINITY_DN29738_c0_g1_i1.p1  ORF type:complete len:791 (+),score=391.42 TRINITY_DN29738_c0_g1_i1:63-2375(+)
MSVEPNSPRASGTLMPGKISYEEVKRHNTDKDCWMIICGKVYDLTDFAEEHPGGAAVVQEQAGFNATEPFLHAHPESIMTLTLGKEGLEKCLVGEIDMSTVPDSATKKAGAGGAGPGAVQTLDAALAEVPPIDAVLNLHDLEAIAYNKLVSTGKKQAWDYYSSGADDELTYRENVSSFGRIWLKPRVMVDVKAVETETTLLSSKSRFPVYLSAVAMCGMGHEDGEKAWMEAANEMQIPFMVPNLSSKSFDDIMAAKSASQDAWFQIYVNPDKSVVLDQIKKLEAAKVKALCITVDSAVPGKRERDLRNKIAQQLGQQQGQGAAAKGTKARKAGNYANRDPGLNWEDLEWFKRNTKIPLVLKGIQCGEDAVLAAKKGCKGIILSNHGGRNLDTSRSGIEVLPEVMEALREEGLEDVIEVFVDGGVRRGTDIVKALAMGAAGVGLGKPAVYAMSAYGKDGIVKMLEILEKEFIISMQLVGAPDLASLKPRMVDCRSLSSHTDVHAIVPSPYRREGRDPKQKTGAELRGEIATLQEQLKVLEGDKDDEKNAAAAAMSNALFFFPVLAKSVGKSVFSRSISRALHRSAVLLFLYSLCYALGSLTVFLGRDTFNAFQNVLEHSQLFFLLECYILLGAGVHALAAAYFTSNKLNYIMKNPLQNGRLLCSSIAIVLFSLHHFNTFRLSDIPVDQATGVKDYYAVEVATFADPINMAIYAAGIAAIFVHLQAGWPKTVLKMNLPHGEADTMKQIGQMGVYPIAAALLLSPLYFHLESL